MPTKTKYVFSTNKALIVRVSAEFRRILNEWFTEDDWHEINDGAGPNDVCDANMAMEEAFDIIFKTKKSKKRFNVYTDDFTDDLRQLWNKAWEHARSKGYKVEPHTKDQLKISLEKQLIFVNKLTDELNDAQNEYKRILKDYLKFK